MQEYPDYYHSKESFEAAQEYDRKLREEIHTAMIKYAPTEEIRLALLKMTGRGV